MKILLVNTFYNEEAGAQKSTKFLAEELVKIGHDVSVFSIDSKTSDLVEKINGVKVYRRFLKSYNPYYQYRTKTNFFIKSYYKIHEIYNKETEKKFTEVLKIVKPDVVHFNCFNGIPTSCISIAHFRNIKTLATFRDYFVIKPISDKIKHVQFFERYYDNSISKHLNNLDMVTAPSKYTLDEYKNSSIFNKTENKFKVVPNAVAISKDALEKSIIRRRSEISRKSKTRFIFVGSIIKIKGIFELVSAFKSLDIYPDISLTIAGKGSESEKLEKVITSDKRIKYVGFKNNKELLDLFQQSDIIIVPSNWDEPFGRVVIEGNSNGLPAIVTNRGGLPEIISTLNSGEACEINNLSKTMKKFIEMDNYYFYYNNILKNIQIYEIHNQAITFLELYLK